MPMTPKRTCEWLIDGAERCGAEASFLVSQGRQYDAQDSCRRHLAATATAFLTFTDSTVIVKRIRSTDG